jgi:hypothetical protein
VSRSYRNSSQALVPARLREVHPELQVVRIGQSLLQKCRHLFIYDKEAGVCPGLNSDFLRTRPACFIDRLERNRADLACDERSGVSG